MIRRPRTELRQNTSHAVMAQRIEAKDSPDDFPTPPWATRALIEHVLENKRGFQTKSCLEPACGAGHMARVLNEYFGTVVSSDAYDYGFGPVRDFLKYPFEINSVDWVITNPPFRLSRGSCTRGLQTAREGMAIFAPERFLLKARVATEIYSRKHPQRNLPSSQNGYQWFEDALTGRRQPLPVMLGWSGKKDIHSTQGCYGYHRVVRN